MQEDPAFRYIESTDPASILTSECFAKDPVRSWEWLVRALKEIEAPTHLREIIEFYKDMALGGIKITFITAALDGIFNGQSNSLENAPTLIELRGNAQDSRCSDKSCATLVSSLTVNPAAPYCSSCGKNLRPNSVLLDELISKENPKGLQDMRNLIQNADCLVIIGSRWYDESELGDSIFLHIMKNKPVVEFAQTSRLRAGKVKFVPGDPVHTVPKFVHSFHKLIAMFKERRQTAKLRKAWSMKPKGKVHNWEMVFPSTSSSRRAPLLGALKGKNIAKSAHFLCQEKTVSTFESKWNFAQCANRVKSLKSVQADKLSSLLTKQRLQTREGDAKLRKDMLAFLLSNHSQ